MEGGWTTPHPRSLVGRSAPAKGGPCASSSSSRPRRARTYSAASGFPASAQCFWRQSSSAAGHNATVQAEVIAPLDVDALRKADLVGISAITSTAPRAYAIADDLRAPWGARPFSGGTHPTALPEEALGHAPWVVRGEGERALEALVAALESRRGGGTRALPPSRTCPGDATTDSSATTRSLRSSPWNDLPEPDWRLVRGADPSGRCRGGTAPVQSSRGCPFACSFCAVTGIFGRSLRFRDVDAVVETVRPYARRRDVVFFYDDNFAADRERTAALCEALIRARIPHFEWSAQVRADVARDPELLSLMRRSGAHTFYVGLESAAPATLQAMNKRQSLAEMRAHLTRIRSIGIRVHGMFVLGLDTDNADSVARTVQFAVDERLSSAQFLILIPLPGTQVYDALAREGRLLHQDWSQYDGHHVVFEPRKFSPHALQLAQLAAHARFYSPRRELHWLSRAKVKSAAICHYARGITRAWERGKRPVHGRPLEGRPTRVDRGGVN